jgi:carbamoyl-phosphate synthase large subunit
MQIPPQFAKIAISKRRLYEVLQGTDLVPDFQIIDKKKVLTNKSKIHLSYPFWVRDYSEGTTSGKGSFAPSDYEELKAWLSLNPEIDNFMFSAYLPGRNLACFLLYNKGVLLKYGVAQRIDYLMGKVSMSGITGNTCKGKLLNDPDIFETAQKAVEIIFEQTGETKHGLIVVDLKEDQNRKVLVTEINIRHVAFTSSFADAGFNFSEYQLLCILNREKELLSEKEKIYPEDNLILRDVDGLPIYIEQFEELKVGDYYIQNA